MTVATDIEARLADLGSGRLRWVRKRIMYSDEACLLAWAWMDAIEEGA